jgi:hypothetical protein
MDDEISKALKDYQEAFRRELELFKIEPLDINKPIKYLNKDDIDKMSKASEETRKLKVKYYTLLFQKRGLSDDQINEWLEKHSPGPS